MRTEEDVRVHQDLAAEARGIALFLAIPDACIENLEAQMKEVADGSGDE